MNRQDVARAWQSDWQSSSWYSAFTLTERLPFLQVRINEQAGCVPEQTERAVQMLQRWKEQVPFNTGSFWASRLAMDGMIEHDLLALLAESTEFLQARLSVSAAMAWLLELKQAFEGDDPLHSMQQAVDSQARTAFLKPFQPLLARGVQRLLAGINELSQWRTDLPFDPQTIVSLLFPHLTEQLLPKVNRTLVLEMHVARLQERLQGETARERFASYLQLLGQPGNMLSLLEEYCVLARQVVETIDLWVAYSLEFLSHLCADWDEIRTLFAPEGDPGVLTEVRGGAGDTHRGGRSVMLLTFQLGFQLVYKPRSLAVDRHFQDLLNWLNQGGHQPAYRLIELMDRGTYGWSEFVGASTCNSQEEVERFYERQGSYLALLYALEAMDFHAENVMAAGEHPLLVDLEALFHPRFGKGTSARAEHPAQKVLDQSVLGIGLLPARAWSNRDAAGVDISGLGGQEGQFTPQPTPKWDGIGTDEMRLVRERVEMAPGHNRPRLHGQEVQTAIYCEHIIKGFTTMYRRLMAHRDELLDEWLPRFAHDEIRFIARPTRLYALLLWESFHPNLLRDALKRDRFFDRLWVGVPQEPALTRLIPAERADLRRGDIPMFTTHPESRDLFTAQGERIGAFFDEPGLVRAQKRVQMLDEDDLAKQTRTIRASFASLFTGGDSGHVTTLQRGEGSGVERSVALPSPLQSPWTHSPHAPVTRERSIQAACAVGNRLCEVAVCSEEAVGWLGLTLVHEREWQLGPADQGLYAGTPGIILFLAYLGKMTGEASYTTLARSALPTVRYEAEQCKKRPAKIGAFEGLGAAIYLYSHLGTLWQEPLLLKEAGELVAFLPLVIEQDEMLDIIAGSAGCVASLLSLYSVAPSKQTLAAAVQCGDHLCARARSMQVGVGWKLPWQETPLAGFAHGAAGIAYSLQRLAEASGQERFRHTAHAALAYERSLFSPAKQNWLDLRGQAEQADDDPGMVAWCYGAAGIGLGRLGILMYAGGPDDATTRQEIDIAIETTINAGFGGNHCLCHGDAGNLEAMLLAAQLFDVPGYHQQVERLAGKLLESIDINGWRTGVPFGVETPGLMTGIAGIGYQLLRLAAPEWVPSVLLLAPPLAETGKEENHV